MFAGLRKPEGHPSRTVAAAEVLAWWAVLTVLWLMLISTVDTVEVVVGTALALPAAAAARAARLAARRTEVRSR
ncbi:hypothetical protein K378_03902 [Streptomyces sp. Amel2xB2]|uniref:hypothetical protein n=1 Tax=Streptomyces sp. Amel2xB2 TaxID=1305829 RepID=UPI000DBFC7AB|nr:hypothetical protein [Streptomyces sp. Amel2xB2]RAJ62549.1 hypothetical protein K378_03902 [Streptomyces sp. Amel2xB2]